MSLHVLTLSTLFPDASRPNFGVFVERQTRELGSRAGVHVTVMAPLGIAPWPLSRVGHYAVLRALPHEETWRGLTVHRPRFPVLPGLGGRMHVTAMTRAIAPLVRAIHARHPIDVIDASFFFPDGPVAANLSRMLDIPFSVKARGADIHHWGVARSTRAQILRAGVEAGGLLAVSAAMKQSMVDLGMPADKIRVHYTGVDLDRFAPADRMAARHAAGLGDVAGPILLSVGALIVRKGQGYLIDALAALPDATLVLAGAGPEMDAYRAQAERAGVASRVRLLGAVAHDALPALFNAADVMALASASEGLANAWVEALACGTPIVISDVGGARELLDDPRAGRIVARTPEAIAAGIRDILNAPADRDIIRQSALRFTWAANGDALLTHLRAIAASAPR